MLQAKFQATRHKLNRGGGNKVVKGNTVGWCDVIEGWVASVPWEESDEEEEKTCGEGSETCPDEAKGTCNPHDSRLQSWERW